MDPVVLVDKVDPVDKVDSVDVLLRSLEATVRIGVPVCSLTWVCTGSRLLP